MTKKRTPGFDPKMAEAPFQVGNNVVSRQSFYKHEGDPSEYTQVRELYQRVMTEDQRSNLHRNTAELLRVSTHNSIIHLLPADWSTFLIVCRWHCSEELSHSGM